MVDINTSTGDILKASPGKRIVRNTFFQSAGNVVGKFLLALFFFLAALYLGAEEFGRLEVYLAWVMIFGVLADGGLDYLALRDLARHREGQGIQSRRD